MSDEDTEQQQLSEGELQPDPARSVQERILVLYGSKSLINTTLGFWGKWVVESLIVTVPLFAVIAVPGLVAAYLKIHPWFTYLSVIIAWLTVTGSIMSIVWCFTDATVEDQD